MDEDKMDYIRMISPIIGNIAMLIYIILTLICTIVGFNNTLLSISIFAVVVYFFAYLAKMAVEIACDAPYKDSLYSVFISLFLIIISAVQMK